MSNDDDAAGVGCCGLAAVLVLIGLVLQYWLQILIVGLVIGLVGIAATIAVQSARATAQARAERGRCPVCNSWSNSVVLNDIDPQRDPLCTAHGARARNIRALEEELRLDGD